MTCPPSIAGTTVSDGSSHRGPIRSRIDTFCAGGRAKQRFDVLGRTSGNTDECVGNNVLFDLALERIRRMRQVTSPTAITVGGTPRFHTSGRCLENRHDVTTGETLLLHIQRDSNRLARKSPIAKDDSSRCIVTHRRPRVRRTLEDQIDWCR